MHLFPELGTVSLSRLSPQQLQVLYAMDLVRGSSTTTVHHIHMVLHRALHAAFRLGLVQRNVCDLVDPPRMIHHEIVVLSAEQVRMFLEAAKGERSEALFILAITTGMRQGELLALRWKDVDLDAASLTIRTTLQRELRPLLAKTGLPKIRFHDLRHTAATLLLLQGVHVKIVSELLGHASVAITMDLYSHVLPNMQQQAASAMDTLLDSYES